MKKSNFNYDLLDDSQAKHKNDKIDKIKTTDINILLNRVKISRKVEFKKRLILSVLLILFTSCLGIFFLFQ